MNANTLHKLEEITRSVALWTSAFGAAIFAAVFFTTTKGLGFQLERFLTGKEESIVLPVYLGLILATFLGYLIASKQQHARIGGTIAALSVAAIYGWCEYGSDYSYSVGPFLVALASPALFHLASAELQRTAEKRKALVPAEESPSFEQSGTRDEEDSKGRELAVGVA